VGAVVTAAVAIHEPVTIALVDVSAIYWQAWHSGGADQPADAPAHATVRKVAAIAERYPHVAVCCDAGRSWRHDADPQYKANREAKPPEASAQLRRALGMLEADGYPMWKAEGFEADDVIASACVWAVEQGYRVVIVTPDKDLMQLVGPGVVVESTRWQPGPDGEEGCFPVYGPAEVEAKFGVRPSEVGDWLALVGDASDNIPGVKGIGPKRAAELLVTYGRGTNPEAEDPGLLGVLETARATPCKTCSHWETLHAVDDEERRECNALACKCLQYVAAEARITPAIRRALLDGAEQLGKSRKLVTLSDNVQGIAFAAVLERRVTKPRPRIAAAPPPKEEHAPMGLEIEPTEEPETATATQPAMVAERRAESPTVAPVDRPPTTMALAALNDEPRPMATIAQPMAPGSDAWAMSLEPNTLKGAAWLARQIVDSRLYQGFANEEAALVAIVRGRELGIPAMSALAAMHVIKGKLTLSSHLIIGLVLKSGKAKTFRCVETTPTRAAWRAHRVGEDDGLTIDYTIEEAQAAGLLGNDQWKKNPRRMLEKTAGVVAARLVWPDVAGGLYMPEEL